jgi:hypothetical protein
MSFHPYKGEANQSRKVAGDEIKERVEDERTHILICEVGKMRGRGRLD